MKSILLFCMFVIISEAGFAQVNLVPNPSFEDYTLCPTGFDQINRATGWSSYSASPDYLNACYNPIGFGLGIPSNSFGYQFPKDGFAYALVINYDIQHLPFNYREYIGIQMIQPLSVGVKYFVSAFVSKCDSSYNSGATNHFGFQFLQSSYTNLSPLIPNNFAHVDCDSIIFDQQDWVQIFGSFISDTAFQYLAIGNFFDNQHTDTAQFAGFSSGYFVDAVCVSPDSIYSKNWTAVQNQTKSNVKVISNRDHIQFLNVGQSESFSIFDFMGKEVFQGRYSSSNDQFNFPTLTQGIYFLQIKNSFGIKLLIFH